MVVCKALLTQIKKYPLAVSQFFTLIDKPHFPVKLQSRYMHRSSCLYDSEENTKSNYKIDLSSFTKALQCTTDTSTSIKESLNMVNDFLSIENASKLATNPEFSEFLICVIGLCSRCNNRDEIYTIFTNLLTLTESASVSDITFLIEESVRFGFNDIAIQAFHASVEKNQSLPVDVLLLVVQCAQIMYTPNFNDNALVCTPEINKFNLESLYSILSSVISLPSATSVVAKAQIDSLFQMTMHACIFKGLIKHAIHISREVQQKLSLYPRVEIMVALVKASIGINQECANFVMNWIQELKTDLNAAESCYVVQFLEIRAKSANREYKIPTLIASCSDLLAEAQQLLGNPLPYAIYLEAISTFKHLKAYSQAKDTYELMVSYGVGPISLKLKRYMIFVYSQLLDKENTYALLQSIIDTGEAPEYFDFRGVILSFKGNPSANWDRVTPLIKLAERYGVANVEVFDSASYIFFCAGKTQKLIWLIQHMVNKGYSMDTRIWHNAVSCARKDKNLAAFDILLPLAEKKPISQPWLLKLYTLAIEVAKQVNNPTYCLKYLLRLQKLDIQLDWVPFEKCAVTLFNSGSVTKGMDIIDNAIRYDPQLDGAPSLILLAQISKLASKNQMQARFLTMLQGMKALRILPPKEDLLRILKNEGSTGQGMHSQTENSHNSSLNANSQENTQR